MNIQRLVPKKPHKPSSHKLGARTLPCQNYEYNYDSFCGNCMDNGIIADAYSHTMPGDNRHE